MKTARLVAFLFTGLSLTASASAQTQPGQPTLDEQKVQIWCTTIKFVYDDTGRPNLKNNLRCGGSLKEFTNSIKADSQKVYSLLYVPLEGKGVMYKGLGSDKARLQKLETEIINRLKASPARSKDPARMQQVATLDAALKGYLENGTPPGDISAGTTSEAAMPDTAMSTDEATAAAPPGAGPDIAAASGSTHSAGDSLMNKLFGPLGLILSLLSLALYALLRRQVTALAERTARHRSDIDSVKSGALAGSVSSASAARITPELQREIERIVQQRVAEELQKRQPAVASAPVAPVTPAKPIPAAVPPVAQPQPASVSAPAPVPASAAPTPPPAPALTTYEAPATLSEVRPTPEIIPAGSPATSARDDFDSLVPPVQLPAPDSNSAEKSEEFVFTSFTRYVKVPVNGGFSEYDLSEEPQHDSIYELLLDTQFPDVGTFQVNPNPAVHAYAIQSAQYSLREACRYQQPSGPVSRIVTDEEGTVRKIGGVWQIESKADIHFE